MFALDFDLLSFLSFFLALTNDCTYTHRFKKERTKEKQKRVLLDNIQLKFCYVLLFFKTEKNTIDSYLFLHI